MNFKELIIYFVTGGVFTTVIVALEESDRRTLSGFAALIPIFTLVAYIFIGNSKGGVAVGHHAWFVLVGTLVSWVPYMLTVAVLSPKIGPGKAIVLGLGVFAFLAAIYMYLVDHLRLFQ